MTYTRSIARAQAVASTCNTVACITHDALGYHVWAGSTFILSCIVHVKPCGCVYDRLSCLDSCDEHKQA